MAQARGSGVFEFDFSEPGGGMGKGVAPPPAKSRGNHAAAASTAAGAFKKMKILPWTLRIDTAEQLPYTFDGMEEDGKAIVVPTKRENIVWGDYGIDGLHTEAVIERKSLDDLYKTLTHGRARFEREMEALNESPYKFAAVVIEAFWGEVQNPFLQDPNWENKTHPNSIMGTIYQWLIRYPRVMWWAAGSRRRAEEWTFMMLNRYWVELNKRKESAREQEKEKRQIE